MKKNLTVAVVCVASRAESGGDRGEALVASAAKALRAKGLDVVQADRLVWDPADALAALEQVKSASPDLVAVVHATWVLDSLQYIFVKHAPCPVLLWAVPYPETFSLACVQHFGSILRQLEIPYQWCYGLAEDEATVEQVCAIARTAALGKLVANARIALIGPRQTWRVANAQDMVKEEWDFSKKFGTTIVHIEMQELLDAAAAHSDQEADAVISEMRRTGRLGTVKADPERMRAAARTYLGVKDLAKRYGLAAAAAECYPAYGGLANVPASWLADEGFVLDTEGDIGHTLLAFALSQMGTKTPVALGEIGRMDKQANVFELLHEGSSAHSLAAEVSQVVIQNGGAGTMVGFPYAPHPVLTLVNMVGVDGRYQVSAFTAASESISHSEWATNGSKLMIRVRVDDAGKKFERMLEVGADHHFLVKKGDVMGAVTELCGMLGVPLVRL